MLLREFREPAPQAPQTIDFHGFQNVRETPAVTPWLR